MKRIAICLMTIAFLLGAAPVWGGAQKKADKATEQWRYELQDINKVSKQGTVTFKVWSYSKKENIAASQAPKNAIHGILFKGYGSHAPMVSPAAAEQHADFFEEFFKEGGGYRRFVQTTNNGAPLVGDKMKVGKEWKVGIIVVVSETQLRKYLEQQGVINKLGSMF
ncbi:MAG: hypothetical protein J6M55_00755 [Paludibacteraceae bacterium]|nr:hypothetical protein [Paludibacteraceae bacterium]